MTAFQSPYLRVFAEFWSKHVPFDARNCNTEMSVAEICIMFALTNVSLFLRCFAKMLMAPVSAMWSLSAKSHVAFALKYGKLLKEIVKSSSWLHYLRVQG